MGPAAILISTPAIRCGLCACRARPPRPGRTGPRARSARPAPGTGRGRGGRASAASTIISPTPPAASCAAPCAFAAVRDITGRLLLVRRCDTGDWELPGGHLDPGESASGAAVRETAEESGITVQVTGLVGIYTDPGHVIADPRTGLVRQPFAVCFHARPLSGSPGGDQVETSRRPVVHRRRHRCPADPPGRAAADRPRAGPGPSLPHRLRPALPAAGRAARRVALSLPEGAAQPCPARKPAPRPSS